MGGLAAPEVPGIVKNAKRSNYRCNCIRMNDFLRRLFNIQNFARAAVQSYPFKVCQSKSYLSSLQ